MNPESEKSGQGVGPSEAGVALPSSILRHGTQAINENAYRKKKLCPALMQTLQNIFNVPSESTLASSQE